MKPLKSLKQTLTGNTIRMTLFASWSLLTLLFIIYIAGVWLSTSDRLLIQLDSINRLISKETHQQAQQLKYQLKILEKHTKASQLDLTAALKDHDALGYDHSFLIDDQGLLIASTFNLSADLKPDLSKPLIKHKVIESLLLAEQAQFAPTFSLDTANSQHFVPICQSTKIGTATLLCLAVSPENELFNWNSFNKINDTAVSVIGRDYHLLYANPLPMQKRTALGKAVAPQLITENFTIDPKHPPSKVVNMLGLDGVMRIGIVEFLSDQELFVIVSIPTSHAMKFWLQQISIPFFMLLAFIIISRVLARFAIRLFKRAKAVQHVSEVTLNEQKNTLKLLFSNLPGIIYRIHFPSYKVIFITEGCNDLLGFSANDYLISGKKLFDAILDEDKHILSKHAEALKDNNNRYENVFRIKSSNGEIKWVMDRGSLVKQTENVSEGTHYLEGVLLDITEHMLSRQQVEYLATRDPLTELANRYLFTDELVSHIAQHKGNTSLALLCIDLDRFKTINDSLGHQVGDRLLSLVSERLSSCIDENILLARLGGDEFILMMKNPQNLEAVTSLAQTINLAISQPYELDHYRLNTSCSIGISMYPQDSIESDILLRNADTAMFSAKELGGNCFQFYTDEMNQKVHSRLTIETELRRAIAKNEFEVHYQPQVNARSGELEGAEALVRWVHPTAGMISPDDFIPIAEETGLIKDIGDWVLQEACSTFQQWNLEAELNLSLAVNVSVIQLNDRFVLRIKEILNETGLKNTNLELEITESLLMNDVQENIRILENINRQGIRFAMDDFGTGYSSLSYLRQFPIGKLKIDRSFVNDITDDDDDEAIIRAIIAMGQTLKLKVIAEGVENHQQLVLLQSMGCDSYQGYYFSKPLNSHSFYEKYIQPAATQALKNRKHL